MVKNATDGAVVSSSNLLKVLTNNSHIVHYKCFQNLHLISWVASVKKLLCSTREVFLD